MIVLAGQSNAEGLAGPLKALLADADVTDMEIGGSSLDPRIDGHPMWLHQLPDRFRNELGGKHIDIVWWIQGENEAMFGPVTEQEYHADLMELRQRMAMVLTGPFVIMISPIAAPHDIYKHSRPVLAAQYRAAREEGFALGPEYHDLPHNHEHLTAEGKQTFAERGAAVIRQIMA